MKKWYILSALGALMILGWIAGLVRNRIHYQEMIGNLKSEVSYAEKALDECLVGYSRYKDIEANWMGVRTCLEYRSDKRPFSVWCGGIGLYSSEEINNVAMRNRVLAANDQIRLLDIDFEGKWKGAYLVRKRVIRKMADRDVEMNLEFIVDRESLPGK